MRESLIRIELPNTDTATLVAANICRAITEDSRFFARLNLSQAFHVVQTDRFVHIHKIDRTFTPDARQMSRLLSLAADASRYSV